MTADADEKYRLMYATGNYKDESSVAYIVDTDRLRAQASTTAVNRNSDTQTVHYVGTMKQSYIEQYILGLDPDDNVYYLINTSGSIIKNKTAVKDGFDWYYYVDDKKVKMYTDTKDLKGDIKDAPVMDQAGNVLKDDWKKADIAGEATPTILDIMRYLGDRSGLQDKLMEHLGDFQ